jgi:pilus assembly protein CpaC
VLDVTMTGPRELYLLGKAFGIFQRHALAQRRRGERAGRLGGGGHRHAAAHLAAVLPSETAITVRSAADPIVLTGTVTSALKAEHAVAVAEGFVRAYARPVAAAGLGLAPGRQQARRGHEPGRRGSGPAGRTRAARHQPAGAWAAPSR